MAWHYEQNLGAKTKKEDVVRYLQSNGINSEIDCEELNSLRRTKHSSWASKLICRDSEQGEILAQGNTNKALSILKVGRQARN
jgi:hypothetical protein